VTLEGRFYAVSAPDQLSGSDATNWGLAKTRASASRTAADDARDPQPVP
jgi:hypothetical protein